MDQWIFGIVPAVIFAAAMLLQQASGSLKTRQKRSDNYDQGYVVASTNNDYDDNPSWALARPPIRCYSCYMSVHGHDCLRLNTSNTRVAIEFCPHAADQCMVHQLKENDKLTTFSRGCTSRCKPGCRAAGVNFVYEECHTCCKGTLCNIGAGAGVVSVKLTAFLGVVLMSVVSIA